MNNHIRKIYIRKLSSKIFDHIFGKLTNKAKIHNAFPFTEGLKKKGDTIPSNPYDSCTPDGLCITEFDEAESLIDYNDNNNNGTNVNEPMYYCSTVTIPDDEQIYIEKNEVKANQIILSDKMPINELNFKESSLIENGFSSPISQEQTNYIHLSDSNYYNDCNYLPAIHDVYENWPVYGFYTNQLGC